MATIYDLIEVTDISANTTYSIDNGNLLGVVDGMSGSSLDDGEFDWNDDVVIDGVTYNIDEIQKSTTAGTFTEGDGSEHTFFSSGETNPDAVFLVVSEISDPSNVRYFIIPNDKYGDMNVETIETGGVGNVGFGDIKIISTEDNVVNAVCFSRGTLIEIANNRQVPVEDLQQGDWVMTADHGMNEIKWIGVSKIGAQTLAQHPNLRPIRIKKGALGCSTPAQDLYVSPQHRILVRSKIARRMFDETEVLVAAQHLLELEGIDIVDDAKDVEYYHILLDNHEILIANGAACESLYLGAQALQSVDPESKREIFQIFPEISEWGDDLLSSRTLVPGRHGRKLAARDKKNSQRLIQLEHGLAVSTSA